MTCSGNAWIHGMTQVTAASIAYVATQVRSLVTSIIAELPCFLCRSDLRLRRHLYFPKLTKLLTLKGSITRFWICLKISRRKKK